jgi:ribosomal protein S27AE/uncharacterized membrane protein
MASEHLKYVIPGAICCAVAGILLYIGFIFAMVMRLSGYYDSYYDSYYSSEYGYSGGSVFFGISTGCIIFGFVFLIIGIVLLVKGIKIYRGNTGTTLPSQTHLPSFAPTSTPSYTPVSTPATPPSQFYTSQQIIDTPSAMQTLSGEKSMEDLQKKFCPSCGAQLPEKSKATFCPQCGAPV